ncbi:hypothetical protein DRE_00304 [Drechslerella stenobrocha 248]|uniref:Ribosomal protein L9 domain-containing protein n=1 Tax=Drechslerella stenobrocha 248 TaxID=1043628 RepID=W7HTA6_9PEZI|nr:hypothetical protein DRE_00304 [Drechslerella stenobrocha 248]
MSTPSPFSTILSVARPSRGSALLRLPSLSICSNCLRTLSAPGQQQTRGKKTLPKAIGVKVRLLKDIPGYGPKGSIMMIARGRMRTIWYQRREAEYLTPELQKQLGKFTIVERDPGFKPIVVEKKKVEAPTVIAESLLTNEETVITLSSVLPPYIRFYRSTTNPNTDALHGSVTASDVANAIKMIAGASKHHLGNRIVINSENITFAKQPEADRVKQLGEYDIEITFKGEQVIKRNVVVLREEVTLPGAGGFNAGANPSAGSIFGVPRQEL